MPKILVGVLGAIILIPLTALAVRALVDRLRLKQCKGVPCGPATGSQAPPPVIPVRFSKALFQAGTAPTPGSALRGRCESTPALPSRGTEI